jgi:hypothetical protein
VAFMREKWKGGLMRKLERVIERMHEEVMLTRKRKSWEAESSSLCSICCCCYGQNADSEERAETPPLLSQTQTHFNSINALLTFDCGKFGFLGYAFSQKSTHENLCWFVLFILFSWNDKNRLCSNQNNFILS